MKLIPETALDHLVLHIQQHYKTQTAAAKAWGMGQSYLSAIVTGERPIPEQLLEVIGWEWRLVPKETPLGVAETVVPERVLIFQAFDAAAQGIPNAETRNNVREFLMRAWHHNVLPALNPAGVGGTDAAL